jgi:hypothetical protein
MWYNARCSDAHSYYLVSSRRTTLQFKFTPCNVWVQTIKTGEFVKVRWCLCIQISRHVMEAHWGNGGTTLRIHNVTYVAFRPGCFKHREITTYPRDRRCGYVPEPARQLRREKFVAATRNRTPNSAVVQSVAHPYAECSRMKTVEWNYEK